MSKTLDADKLFDLLEQGIPNKHIAKELGISTPTLSKRIADLQQRQGLLLNYRNIQALHLTSLQAQLLEAISPDKIEEASLKDLVLCYKVLKDKELVVEGKPSEIKGLVSYLVHMEKEQIACEQGIVVQQDSSILSCGGSPINTCDGSPLNTCDQFDDAEFSEELIERMPKL